VQQVIGRIINGFGGEFYVCPNPEFAKEFGRMYYLNGIASRFCI
jgi:hypothetical protein